MPKPASLVEALSRRADAVPGSWSPLRSAGRQAPAAPAEARGQFAACRIHRLVHGRGPGLGRRFRGRPRHGAERGVAAERLAAGPSGKRYSAEAPREPGPPESTSVGRGMASEQDRELRALLARLKEEHRDLDAAIAALEKTGTGESLQVQRLKKKKLMLKDRITHIEDQLLPDIIA